MSSCSSSYVGPSIASYTEQQLSSSMYTTIPLNGAPELTPAILSDANICSTHSPNQEQFMDLNGFQGMPHLTLAEGLEPPPSEGC